MNRNIIKEVRKGSFIFVEEIAIKTLNGKPILRHDLQPYYDLNPGKDDMIVYVKVEIPRFITRAEISEGYFIYTGLKDGKGFETCTRKIVRMEDNDVYVLG